MLQVKQIEERDSVLTSKQQIDRLTRPGATYFNLNPFDVCTVLFFLIKQNCKAKAIYVLLIFFGVNSH